MVRRTEVEPPVCGQVAGVMTIWASVRAGSSDVAALRTAARAAAGSFCRAITLTPSRAAADSVPETWKARPNSANPRIRTISSGRMKANSTDVAPRSSRKCLFMCVLLLPVSAVTAATLSVQRRSGPPAGEPLRRWQCSALRQGVDDLLEERVELVAEDHDRRDDRDGDEAHHQAVLDGGGALLLTTQAVLGEGDEADERGERVHLWCSLGGVAASGTGRLTQPHGCGRQIGTESPRLEPHPPARRTSALRMGDGEHHIVTLCD